jgi:hypothetical protein
MQTVIRFIIMSKINYQNVTYEPALVIEK